MKALVVLFSVAVFAGISIAEARAAEKEGNPYVGSQACMTCHAPKHSAWTASKHATKASESTPDWPKTCAGCHTTHVDMANFSWDEADIGCEACHGPGRDHVAAPGDKSKIVASKSADVCGQCHVGTGTGDGGKLMSDGTRWVVGYRPGMKLSSVQGLQLDPIDPSKTPPESGPNHRRIYPMWLASGHSKALSVVGSNSQASPDCYRCHSDEGFRAKLMGKALDIAPKADFNPVTCATCHDPHSSKNPHQLVMDPETLCTSCHTQREVLEGKGAKGIDDIRSVHSAVDCIGCHMTEGNHLMKVIRPDDPGLSAKRLDTCTTCHKDNNRKARAGQIQDWQASYKQAMDPLQADLKTVSTALKAKPDVLDEKLKAKLNDVRANLFILVRDGSRGAHNPDFASEIMSLAAKNLAEIKAAVK